MVSHLGAFQQRASYWYHGHALFAKDACVVNGKRVSLDGARMCREQNLVVFHPLPLPHLVSNYLLIFLSDKLVLLYFFLKHRYAFFPALTMHQAPRMTKGMESICPMSIGSEASKAS